MKVLVIVGPTGVGKSSLSIEVAKQYQGEIISGDAYQCYKELTIGSAKITEDEMQGIPHHLVDELSYKETYNVKMFQEQARARIAKIHEQGKLPIICGGTGLYIKSLLYDYVFHEEAIDVAYAQELDALSNEALYERLKRVDKEASNTIHINNRKRVKRALMMEHLGHKKSDVVNKQEHVLLYDALIIGLTMDRQHLYQRIDERVLTMIEDGLEREVMSLVSSIQDFDLQSMQGIGYKEWKGYYENTASLQDTILLIQKNTRNFAKRQYTWFYHQLDVHWFDIESDGYKERIYEAIEEWKG